jgi:hypothetical protein
MSPEGDTLEYGYNYGGKVGNLEMCGYILDRDKPTFFALSIFWN